MNVLPKPQSRTIHHFSASSERDLFAALENLDESLSTRTFGIVGFAVVVVASLGAAATSGHVPYWLFLLAVVPLAVGVCAAVASLIRGRTTTRWEVALDAKAFAEEEAGRIRQRVRATQLALGFLAVASLATAVAALYALHFKDNGTPVTCQVTLPKSTTQSPENALVECRAG